MVLAESLIADVYVNPDSFYNNLISLSPVGQNNHLSLLAGKIDKVRNRSLNSLPFSLLKLMTVLRIS